MESKTGVSARKTAFIFFGCFIFFFFQIIGLHMDGILSGEGMSLSVLVSSLLLTIAISIPMPWLILRAVRSEWFHKLTGFSPGGKELPFATIFFLIFIPYFLVYLAYYPGNLAYDVFNQWYQYTTGNFSTHHPLIHTLLMCGMFTIGKDFNTGIALYSFLQMFVLTLSITFGLSFVQKLKVPGWLTAACLVYFSLFPVFPVLGVSATKDVLFGALFLTAFLLGIKAAENKEGKGIRWLFPGTLALSILFRNNAIYAAAAECVLLLILLPATGKKRFAGKIIIGIFAAIVASEAGFVGLKQITNAEDGSIAEMLSVPIQQLARVYNYEYEKLDQDDLNTLNYYIPLIVLPNYNEVISDPVKTLFITGNYWESPSTFFRFWLSVGKKCPFTYADSFLRNTAPLWKIGDRSNLRINNDYLAVGFHRIEDSVKPDSKLPALKKALDRLAGEGEILDIPVLSLLASMALYFWLLFMAAWILLAEKQFEMLYLPLLPLLYMMTLLLGPCIDLRYCLAPILCTPFMLAYLIHIKNTKQTGQNTETP